MRSNYLQKNIYQQVKQRAGTSQISHYINDTLTEKIRQEQKKETEKFRQQLIADWPFNPKSNILSTELLVQVSLSNFSYSSQKKFLSNNFPVRLNKLAQDKNKIDMKRGNKNPNSL